MSTNHTPNYNLSLWEASDQVMRTEFNENHAKIDAALGAKLERSQLLCKTAVTEVNQQYFTFDISGIDWDEWEYVVLSYDPGQCLYANAHGVTQGVNLTIQINNGSFPAYCFNTTGVLYSSAQDLLEFIFLPRHNGNRRMHCITLGTNASSVYSDSPFSQIQSLRLVTSNGYLLKGTTMEVWGTR